MDKSDKDIIINTISGFFTNDELSDAKACLFKVASDFKPDDGYNPTA